MRHNNTESLPWKTVSRPIESGLDGDEGILELEEVEGVEIIYEETEQGKVAKFHVRSVIFSIIAGETEEFSEGYRC